jgi:hypothetical protein
MTANELVYEIIKCFGTAQTISDSTIETFVCVLSARIGITIPKDVVETAKSKIDEMQRRAKKGNDMILC